MQSLFNPGEREDRLVSTNGVMCAGAGVGGLGMKIADVLCLFSLSPSSVLAPSSDARSP